MAFGLLAKFGDLPRGAKGKEVCKSLLFNFFWCLQSVGITSAQPRWTNRVYSGGAG